MGVDSVGSRVDVEADGPAAETDPFNLPRDQTFRVPWEGGGFSSTSHTFVSGEALCPLLSCSHLCTGNEEVAAWLGHQLSLTLWDSEESGISMASQ